MIATAIPHAAFDKPECPGFLAIFGRAHFIIEFVCSDCGEVVASAREDDMPAALQNLNFAAGLTCIHCPRCGFANDMAGRDVADGRARLDISFACHRCGRNLDLAVAKGPSAPPSLRVN